MAFTIYLIHHSHTDIGYTDYQEKIESNHIYYIRHALWILEHAHSDRPQWLGFVWQCECWWAVEKFLQSATKEEQERFWHYVKSGEIGLSSSYLNLTELIDEEVLGKFLQKAGIEGERNGISVTSAMTADINGYSWGFSEALAKAGTKNLLSFIHTHHGRYPMFQKQMPFWWITPSNKEVLVWLGDHYQMGNELGASKLQAFAYTCFEDGIGVLEAGEEKKAEKRIYNYVETLKRQGYPYDFTVVGLSGAFTDNACPSPFTAEFVNEFNSAHLGEIEFKLVTLDEFFERVREADRKKPFPKYKGDWSDWWADGVGSSPVHVQHFREAQRKLSMARKLDPENKICDKKLLEDTEQDLMIYAEHTWGHSASVSDPCDPGVNRLALRKELYAQRAHESASRALLRIAEKNGTTPTLFGQGETELVVINPQESALDDVVSFEFEVPFGENIEVYDVLGNTVVPHQTEPFSRGVRLYIQTELKAHEEKRCRIKRTDEKWKPSAGIYAKYGADGICDMPSVQNREEVFVSPWKLENNWVRIRFDEEYGVTEIYDKKRGTSLLRQEPEYPPFTPIYEHTPVDDKDQCKVRRNMGRNRKAISTERDTGKIRNIRIIESGSIFDKIELEYSLKGTKLCLIILTVYRELSRIDVDLRLHKESVWDPENLYLALPFTGGSEDTLWIEKTGSCLRPRIDQLFGSCIDFYLVQSGVWYTGDKGTVLIAVPDNPLITLGELKAHPILLSGENEKNSDMLYSWVMNNYWETNFKADLGGFHQYHYSILSTKEKDTQLIREKAQQLCMGAFSFQGNIL